MKDIRKQFPLGSLVEIYNTEISSEFHGYIAEVIKNDEMDGIIRMKLLFALPGCKNKRVEERIANRNEIGFYAHKVRPFIGHKSNAELASHLLKPL